MDKELGKEYEKKDARIEYLRTNADAIESLGYMKQFTPDEITLMRADVSTVLIKANDIEEEKKEVMAEFKEKLKPFHEQLSGLLKNIKHGAEFIEKDCYKFLFENERMVGYFNEDGDLVQSRPARPEEMQKTTFSIGRKTGTDDN